MFILIFFIILSVLVFVHEMGHFLAAKWAGVKVEEFGFGYPPRAVKIFRKWNTDFTLNWIPFGGFVKILGENYTSPPTPLLEQERGERKFTEANKLWQIIILAAGVIFNVILAWVLFSATYLIGTPYPVESEYRENIHAPVVMVTSLVSGMPAEEAGLKAGDVIEHVHRSGLYAESANGELTTEAISQFIGSSAEPVTFEINRGKEELSFTVTPIEDADTGRLLAGIGMDEVGMLKLGFFDALLEGAKTTKDVLLGTFHGIIGLITSAFKGEGDLSQVAGPVGIVGLVKDAALLGFTYLLSFTALISINLAIVNLIPFPALDGGRIVMVIIEKLKGSPVNPNIYNTLNTVGFFLLIALMLVITFHDITRLF